MDPKQLPVTCQAEIPETYLDDMKHMNVMWYTHLFGRATGGLFKLLGLTREYFEEHHSGTFALEQHFRYLAEVRVGQHITIRSRFLGHSAKKIHAIHMMTNDTREVLAATCEFIGIHVDMRVRRSSLIPEDMAKHLEQIAAEHAKAEWEPGVITVMKP